MQHFSATQLAQYLREATHPPLLLDVREPWEFEICAIENSKLLPMREVVDACQDWDRNQEIVAICHHGIRSRSIAIRLERLGFTRVINLSGGVEAWARDVDPNMATY